MPPKPPVPPSPPDGWSPETLAVIVERHIDHTLAHTGGNKYQAARLLGIDRRTLYRKLGRKSEKT